jgi:hypothetical protein
MRYHEIGLVHVEIVDEQDVNVERPRSPSLVAHATGCHLQRVTPFEQRARGVVSVQLDNEVEVRTLTRRSTHWLRLVHGRHRDHVVAKGSDRVAQQRA